MNMQHCSDLARHETISTDQAWSREQPNGAVRYFTSRTYRCPPLAAVLEQYPIVCRHPGSLDLATTSRPTKMCQRCRCRYRRPRAEAANSVHRGGRGHLAYRSDLTSSGLPPMTSNFSVFGASDRDTTQPAFHS